MLGFGRQVSFSLAGWLWADLLLGMFAIFLAANAVAPAVAAQNGIDPKPVEFRVEVSSAALFSSDPAVVAQEQARIAEDVLSRLQATAPGRRAAIVFAYGAHESAAQGDKIAQLGLAELTDGPFAGAVLKPLHELVTGDTSTSIAFEIYLHE